MFSELQFFPKTEKYVPLFIGVDDSDMIEKRNKLRKQIKANLIAAAASGKDLEGTLHCPGYIFYLEIPYSSVIDKMHGNAKGCQWKIKIKDESLLLYDNQMQQTSMSN